MINLDLSNGLNALPAETSQRTQVNFILAQRNFRPPNLSPRAEIIILVVPVNRQNT